MAIFLPQEHWEHEKPGLTTIDLSFHLRPGGGTTMTITPQPGHMPEEDRPQAGTTPSPLLTGAERLAPLRRREQALTKPSSSRLSPQIERVPCGFGDPFLPHPCPSFREKLKAPKKQVTCPDSTPRVRATPTLLKK